MKRYYILVLLTAFSILTFTGKPIQSQIDFGKFKVHVGITCKDDNTKASIESHIKRELRSLQDVQIIAKSEDSTHNITIIAALGEYKQSRQKTGRISLAYMFLDRFRISTYKNQLTNHGWELLNVFENTLYLEPYLGVGDYHTDDINKLCESIVVRFDTNKLEPLRKTRSEILKMIE